MLSQAVRITLRTTSATGFSQAVAMDLDDGKLCMACRGSAVRIRLAPYQRETQSTTEFLAVRKDRFFDAKTAKYQS